MHRCLIVSLFLTSSTLLSAQNAPKLLIIFEEKLELCVEPEKRANLLDFSDFHLIATNDEVVYANGSIKFMKDMGSKPVRAHLVAEKFRRGSWHVTALNMKRPDFCEFIHDSKEMLYSIMKDFKCPGEAGDVWIFDMTRLDNIVPVTETDLIGRWRFSVFSGFEEGDEVKYDCSRYYFEIVYE